MPFPSNQGTQALLREQCEALARRGHDVHLLVYAHGGWTYQAPGVVVHRLRDWPRDRSLRSGPSLQKIALDLQLTVAVRRWSANLRPDVVHAHNYEALLACLLARPKAPVVYHAHTLFGQELPTYLSTPSGRALAALAGEVTDRIVPSRAHRTLAVSPRLVDELIRRGHPPERVECSLPGIDVPSSLPDRRASRLSLGLSGMEVVGYSGNLDGYQDLETLLDALALLAPGRPMLRALIVTSSDEAPLLRAAEARGLADRLVISPHGTFSEAFERVAAANVCVVSRSAPGGFPIKLLTYLAAGRPAVTTVAGCAGLDLGGAVTVVPDGDAAAMAGAIQELLDDPADGDRRGRAGRKLATTTFTWDRAVAVLEEQLHHAAESWLRRD